MPQGDPPEEQDSWGIYTLPPIRGLLPGGINIFTYLPGHKLAQGEVLGTKRAGHEQQLDAGGTPTVSLGGGAEGSSQHQPLH